MERRRHRTVFRNGPDHVDFFPESLDVHVLFFAVFFVGSDDGVEDEIAHFLSDFRRDPLHYPAVVVEQPERQR